ncbi:hypothetical protein [Limimaricola hongkongensis]|uniref:hypothetical protein n=1 Tax=Limimaricola hongkongensis TaxID=278132 RepID=UPI0013A589BB|nr:hypothetical protein [Limimaricola hongkongensis]
MARLLALCLFLIGLLAQSVPIAAEAMPAMHESPAVVAMTDCANCPEEAMPGGDVCQDVGACASGAVALDLMSPDWPFFSAIREVQRVFGYAAPGGASPAPLLEPPRYLI